MAVVPTLLLKKKKKKKKKTRVYCVVFGNYHVSTVRMGLLFEEGTVIDSTLSVCMCPK